MVGSQAHSLRRADVPRAGLTRALAEGVRQTWLGAGRFGTQFAAPLLVAVAVGCRGGNRVAALSLLLGPPLTDWYAGRRGDPVRYTLAHLADDIAYGGGVLAGCARLRTFTPLRPRLTNEETTMANSWFESVAEAQRRAKKRLPKSVYSALVAGSERGITVEDNTGRVRRARLRAAHRGTAGRT